MEKRCIGLGVIFQMNNKLNQVPEEFKKLAEDFGKNGFITTSLENLKKEWVPTWVVKTNDTNSGNQEIVNQGGEWISSDLTQIDFKKIFSQAKRQDSLEF